jgi:hypothetical protein
VIERESLKMERLREGSRKGERKNLERENLRN